jgi:tyrosine-protein kinase Etk/Wzc
MEDQIKLPENGTSNLSNLTIRDLFYKYVRFLPLFIISVALSLFVAYVYLRYATLIYRSTGTMVIKDDKSSSGGNDDKFEQMFQSDNTKNIQNEIEYLQSRPMMARVVNALKLNFTYLAQGNIKELNIYKSNPFEIEALQITDSAASFTLKIDFENQNRFRVDGDGGPFKFGDVFRNKYGVFRLLHIPNREVSKQYKVTWQPTSSVAGGFAGSISVAPKPNTGILIISLEATNPHLAADVINQLMIEYQKATIDDKNATTQRKMEFIDKELDIISRQLDSIMNKKIYFIKEYNLVDPKTQSTNSLTRAEKASDELRDQRIQLNIAYQIESYLYNDRSNNSLVPSSLSIDDPTLATMVGAYNQAQIEKKNLSQNAPPGNIAVQQKTQLVENLRQKLLENLKNIKKSYNSVIGSLENTISTSQAEIRLMPEKQRILDEIERQLAGKLDIYKSLLVKREESAITLASTISNMKVLQDAVPSYAPIKPNRKSTQMLAILIGVVLPGLFIFALEMINDKVTTRYDIERITSTTILGEVGHSYSKDALVVTSNNRGVVAEQFRILRSNLQYILNNIRKPVILVTSSFSGEGKSFISTNIGAVMALAGKKTIILEFDIRKPKILSHLNMGKRPGLTNYLLGKVNLEALPVQVERNENLYVLPCGPVPPNPAELLLDPKLADLFTFLRENFDVVIMDTAPVGMVSDAMSLSKFADATLYIVRQGHTYKKQIALLDDFHREGKLPRMAIVLNDVKLRTGYGYYGYGRYGYGYGYGSGYFEAEHDAQPPSVLAKWFGWLDTKRWTGKKRKRTKV